MTDSDLPDGASPPCLMGEADPAYFGYLSRSEVLDLLNLLPECERAGARGVAALAAHSTDTEIRDALREIAADEARFCVMLSGHIKGLLGTPSEETGSFYKKLVALDAFDAQLNLLDRGQGWVAEKLRECLPKISYEGLHRDLAEMLDVHDRNIEKARRLSTP